MTASTSVGTDTLATGSETDTAGLENRPGEAGSQTPEPSRMWFVATLVATLVASLIPLYFFHRYYFANDTETGAFGVWYHLGTEVRSGNIQIFNPHVWMAGNYVAEGQWGFFSPVVVVIGLLASFTGNALLFSTLVKIVFMLVAAGGVFSLARSFGADPRWSMVAGVAAPLSGFAMYMDETAWVTELMIWALLPWFWVALRRTVYQGRNPLLALVMAYLIITIGYVYGTIGVIFVLLAVGIERIARREWAGVRRTLLVGVLAGLVTITVYLPGILTASVTWRNSGISNDGFLQPNLTGLATSAEPTALPALRGYWPGGFPRTPLMYIAWFLPLVVLIDWRAMARKSRELVDAWIVLVLFTMMLFAPAQIGPLRFPVRTMGSFVVTLLPIVVSLLTVARAPRSRRRLYALGAVVLTTAYFSFSQKPVTSHTLVLATVVIAIGCWLVWRSSPAPSAANSDADPRAVNPKELRAPNWWGIPPARVSAVVAVTMVVVSLGFVALQHHSYRKSDLQAYALPETVSAYKNVQPHDVGDGIVVGSVRSGRADPQLWNDISLANTWYIDAHASFQNTYTTIGFAKYGGVVCEDFLGSTCPDLANRLFTQRAATGLLLVDELSIDTVVMIKVSVPRTFWAYPSPGWSITNNTPLTVTWTRNHPVGGAGRPIQESPGTTISDIHDSDRTVSFRVDQIPSGGGGVTLSRLNWPGYSATNASIGAAVDGFLLHVDVPESSRGKTVTVTFTPPGWNLGLATLGLGLLGGLIWSVLFEVRRRRRRQRRLGAPTAPTPVAAVRP